MKTVLFIEQGSKPEQRRLIESYDLYRALLDECAAAFGISVQTWNPEGTTLETMLPDFPPPGAALREWQAIVLADLSFGVGKNRGREVIENPFDVYERGEADPETGLYSLSDECVRNPEPIVLVSRMLGGIPKGNRQNASLNPAEPEAAGADGGESAEGEEGSPLMRRYHLPCEHPQELLLISPRTIDPDVLTSAQGGTPVDARANLERLRPFNEASGYADSARFAVVDRPLPPSSTEYHDALAFWLTVFTLAMDDPRRDNLRYGQLYRACVEFDQQELVDLLADHYDECEAARDQLKDHIQMLRRLRQPNDLDETPLPAFNAVIHMDLESEERQDMKLDLSRFGTFKDRPVLDEPEFEGQFTGIVRKIASFLQLPKRALYAGIAKYQSASAPTQDELDACVLNSVAREELEAVTDELRERLAEAVEPLDLSGEGVREAFQDGKHRVKKAMKPRLTVFDTMFAGGVTLLCILLGFTPFIFGLTGGSGFDASALGLTVLLCLILALAVFLFIRRQRKRFMATLDGFNTIVDDVMADYQGRVGKVATRLSNYATLRNGLMYLKAQDDHHLLVGDEENDYAMHHARLCAEINRGLREGALSTEIAEASSKRNPEYMGFDKAADLVHSGKIYQFDVHSFNATCRMNSQIGILAQTKAPYAFIRALTLEVVNLNGVREEGQR